MSSEDDCGIYCDWCGCRLTRKINWVGLNRWVVSTTKTEMLSECGSSYVWEPDEDRFSGLTFCFPKCLTHWLEDSMIDFETRPEQQADHSERR